jgi:uncharacterized protein YchJ
MRLYLPAAALALAIAVGGCRKITAQDQNAALECVRANLAAMQKGDLDAVLATIHPESPAYLQTPELLGGIVGRYQLAYDLEAAEIEQVGKSSIRVRFVQNTRRISGPDDFPDSRIEGVHVLKRDRGRWKIWFTQVRSAKAIEDAPAPRATRP